MSSIFQTTTRGNQALLYATTVVVISVLIFPVLLGCGGPESTTAKLLVATGYVRQDIGVITRCQSNETLYGERISDSHWVFSTDMGDTWADTGSSVRTDPSGFQQCYFFHGFKFLTTDDGRIFRTTPSDWTNWTEVSVPQRPPMTNNRPDELAANDQYLFYGTYHAAQGLPSFVFRSADNGATWTTVLPAPNNPDVHGIVIDLDHPERIFVNIGDAGPGSGLWFSPANGDPGSFINLSSNLVGVDLLFHNGALIMEGDGGVEPQVLIFPDAEDPQPGLTEPLLTGDPNPPDGKGTFEGVARAMALTAEGNLFFMTKAEGPNRHRSGIFMAAGPSLTQEVLLEEIPVNSIPLCRTMEVGPFLYMERYRIRKPVLNFQ